MAAMVCIAIAFLVAVWANWKHKINMGIVSSVAAFLIGCFLLGLPPKTLKNMLPINVIFPIVSIALFFGYALENGTLVKLVDWILRKAGSSILLYPVLLYCISAALGISGLGAGSIILIVAPIAMRLADGIGLDPIAVSASFLLGGPMGSNYMMSSGGSIVRGLLEDAGYPDAMQLAGECFRDGAVVFTALFLLIYLIRLPVMRRQLRQAANQAVPAAPFSREQKITLWLILGAFLLGTVPPILGVIFPGTAVAGLAGKADIGFIFLMAVLAAELLRLGDLKVIIRKHVPWGILIMLSGVAMLMGVAKESGLIALLADALAGHNVKWLIPGLVVVIAGCMSFFSSAISVVVPTLFAVVPVVAEGSGLPIGLLYSCVVLGASLTGMSPFSTGGALAVANVQDETIRNRMVYQQLLIAVGALVLGAAYMTLRGLV